MIIQNIERIGIVTCSQGLNPISLNFTASNHSYEALT